MERPPLDSFALSNTGCALDKVRSSRSTRTAEKTPRPLPTDVANNEPPVTSKITTVDALIVELRKIIHTMFSTVDPNIPSLSAYENYSRQAFRFFTTTNSITPECFLRKVVHLGLHVTPRLCNELFRRIDQEDLGEFDYPTFAQRVFLPESFYTPEERGKAGASNDFTSRSSLKSPQLSSAVDNNAKKKPLPVYEYMAIEELERCFVKKLEEKLPHETTDSVQAFRFFTSSDTITFTDFHRHLGMLQIQISPPKCRELFVRFDKDNDGVIDAIEFVTTVYTKENHRPNTTGSVKSDSSGASQEPSVSTKQLVAILRERMDHLSEETDRFQQAFMLFGKPTGISRSDLQAATSKLGLTVSEKQLQDLFNMFDFDKTGDLDVNKFVQGVMLDDNSTSFWLSVKDRQKLDDSRQKLYSMAVASVQESWTIADIERMLREKIEQRTSRSSDCFRQAFRIFKKVNGIKSHEFHAALEAIGLALTRVQSDILFRRFDKDGSGDIDLNEFIHGVLPPDYIGISWVAAADELHRIEAKNKKEKAMANPDQYMTEIEMESWSLDEIEMRIRDKIQQSTSRSSDTFRQAYKIFKKASHVTMDQFRERVLTLGFRLTPAQCLGLFKRYDADNSNDLDLQEFCLKILPPDYTHDGDHWSHSEKYKKERYRAKLEYVKRSKNGLIMLPKFIESHRFTRGHHVSHSFKEMPQVEAMPSVSTHGISSSASRPSSSSTIEETLQPSTSRPTTPRPKTPRPSRTLRPSPIAPADNNNNSSHLPSPRHASSGKSTSLSPTSPLPSSHPRTESSSLRERLIDSQLPYSVPATPPMSPRIVSPTRPMSPRTQTSTSTALQHRNYSETPTKPSSKAEDEAVEYEDEEIIDDDDDEAAPIGRYRSMKVSRHRQKDGRPSGHSRHSAQAGTCLRQVSVRPAESVAGSSTSTSSVVVGSAKYMPQRNHVLLIKRFIQSSGKSSEMGTAKSVKRKNFARR